MFFTIPAHLFNRFIILVPIFICFLLGSKYYDQMLHENQFRPAGDKITDSDKVAYGFCFFFLYGICLLLMVCCTQCMKYTIKRERPKILGGATAAFFISVDLL